MLISILHKSNDFEQTYQRHVDTVFRVCYIYMKDNKMDLEDAVQDTFIKLINANKRFESFEHEKAWLIVTATNTCKNYLKSKWKKDVVLSNEIENIYIELEDNYVIHSVLELPKKYKTLIYLYYYEGYKSNEIAKILNKNPSTVRSMLYRARGVLRDELEDSLYER